MKFNNSEENRELANEVAAVALEETGLWLLILVWTDPTVVLI